MIEFAPIKAIEAQEGKAAFIADLAAQLKDKRLRGTSRPVAQARWQLKTAGDIPTITGRVVQMAGKLIIEPLFEADFGEHAHGFARTARPMRRWPKVCSEGKARSSTRTCPNTSTP